MIPVSALASSAPANGPKGGRIGASQCHRLRTPADTPTTPGYSYGYSPDAYGYAGDVDYCMRRFRSYDPRSGTYLGFDGLRHPCR